MPTPTVIQRFSTANTGSTQAAAVCSQLDIRIRPVLANNCVLLAVLVNGLADALTLSDEIGNTYPHSFTGTGSDGSKLFLYRIKDAPAGIRHLTAKITTPFVDLSYFGAFGCEIYNYNSSDFNDGMGSYAPTQNGTTAWTAGSITTVADGDFIWSGGFISNGELVTGFTAGTSATLLTADNADTTVRHFQQYRIQAAAGAINSNATLAVAGSGLMFGWAIKAGSTGTAPPATGILQTGCQWRSMTSGAGSPATFSAPCDGDLVFIKMLSFTGSATPSQVTGVTDNKGNTWEQAGVGATDGYTNPTWLQTWYAKNATTGGDMTITITWDNAPNLSEFTFHCCTGSHLTAPYNGDTAPAAGNQAVNGSLVTSTVSGLQNYSLLSIRLGLAIGAAIGCSDSDGNPVLFDCPTYPQGDGGSNPLAEDNGLASCYNDTASAITFAFKTTMDMRGGVGVWVSLAESWLAATPTPPPWTYLYDVNPKTYQGVPGCDSYFVWQCPIGAADGTIVCQGAGGCGGRKTATNNTGGGGGKGGACAVDGGLALTGGNAYAFRIGGNGSNPAGTVFNGQSTKFVDDSLTICEAAAGVGVANNSQTGATTSTGTTQGVTTFAGGSGATSTGSGGGGGGGGGGTTGAGAVGAVTAGGTGGTGNPAGATGGNGRASGATAAGNAGVAPGAGGGGGWRATTGTGAAGDGGAGMVTISANLPSTAIDGSLQHSVRGRSRTGLRFESGGGTV